MPDSDWGLCKDCKWFQVEPGEKAENNTMGLCIDEDLVRSNCAFPETVAAIGSWPGKSRMPRGPVPRPPRQRRLVDRHVVCDLSSRLPAAPSDPRTRPNSKEISDG